jgi:16S rRNA (cytosine1402-N4)-methyltransferase
MVEEIMAALAPAPGNVAADCTLGYGGHARALLERILPGGRLVGLDVDAAELQRTRERLSAYAAHLVLVRGNFAGLAKAMAEAQAAGFDVVLADLGVSSMQIDDARRGFSYKHDGPLDMRMDDRKPRSAADLLAELPEPRLDEALEVLADEPDHKYVARAIVQERARRAIRRTHQLVEVVFRAKGLTRQRWREQALANPGTTHPAARTFQALRILVNDELSALRQLLRVLPSCLAPGGRAGIICFQSGEERLVRAAFEAFAASGEYAAVSAEPLRPGPQERFNNPRSASARFYHVRRA